MSHLTITQPGQRIPFSINIGDRAMTAQTTQVSPSLDQLFAQQMFTIGCQVGSMISSEQSQKEVLFSGNQVLKRDIVQIQETHLKELKATVDGWEVKAKAVLEKLKEIVKILNTHSEKFVGCGCETIDTCYLQAQIGSFPKIDYGTLKKYPKYPDTPTSNAISKTEPNALSSLDELLQGSAHPFIQDFLQTQKAALKGLTEEIKTLRAEQATLAGQKETIIKFHSSFLKNLNTKIEKDLGLNKIVERTDTLIGRIKWDLVMIPSTECPQCSGVSLTPYTKRIYHEQILKSNNEALKNLHAKVMELLSSMKKAI